MTNQSRMVKVLAALLISMTTGAIVLMALGNNPPSAGPFCLSSYYHLDPVEKSILSSTIQTKARWNAIETYYSNTKAGNIEQLASISGLTSPEDLNCHFVICNGLGGKNGQIQNTEKWQRQWSIIPGKSWHKTAQTIRICVIADPKDSRPTDSQIRRVEVLVEKLARNFDIKNENIYYPGDWQ
ncbi:MAG: peptidoglycan recognition protein family protein [Planctomycetota bacterium]|jgi:hypothetical protein